MSNQFHNEQAVLGGLILLSDLTCDSAQKVFSKLKIGSFADKRHQVIYSALITLEQASHPSDLLTVNNLIERNGELDLIGGVSYLAEVCQSTPTAQNIHAYAEQVRQGAMQRMATNELQNALAELNEANGDDIYRKLGTLESTIASINSRGINGKEGGLRQFKEIGREWFSNMNDRKENPEKHKGISTGISTLDCKLGSALIRRGTLCVVGARPKMGKTALLEAMVKSSSMEQGLFTALFTLEMTELQMADRLISGQAKISSEQINSLKLEEHEWQAMSTAVGTLNQSKLYIDDTPSMTLQHVKKESRKLAKKGKLGFIAIDYLTLMQAEKADRNDLAYGIITKELKQLAKELDCCVLLLTQLNRGLENRTDKRPMPSDSRDTGQIEQDCDYWIGLYRDSVYNEDIKGAAKGYTEALLRLNRYGDTGTASMMLKNGSFYACDAMEVTPKQVNNQNDNKGFI